MSEPQRYILDSSALLQTPEVLARAGSRKLLVPEAVLRELSVRGREGMRNRIGDLINQAAARGVKIVRSPNTPIDDLLAIDRNAQRISGVAIDIARTAIEYSDRFGPSGVCVVTFDRVLSDFLSSRGITAITGVQFLQQSLADIPDAEIQRSAKSFAASQWRFVALSIVLGVLLSLLGQLAFSRLSYLVSTVSVWGTVVALPLLGVTLYWYRQKYRLSYGIFEFIVGFVMTLYVFFPTFSYTALTVVEGIQILGGLYVMVRGMDNVSKGVEGTRVESVWRKLFSSN
jgi:rRNA-processing protein FCF1